MCQKNGNNFNTALCTKIDGVPTEFVFQRFANKHFIVITQYQKMCNLFSVTFDNSGATFPGIMSATTQQLTITPNFGEDTDETRSAINFIINNSNLKNSQNGIICSLGLKKISGKNLREVANIINTFIK